MGKMLLENEQYFKNLSSLKHDFKQVKNEFNSSKIKLVQLLDQMLIFNPKESQSSNFDEGVNKLKFEINGMEKILVKCSSSASNLEMALSKMILVMDGRKSLDFSNINNNFIQAQNTIDNYIHDMENMQLDGQKADENLINVLKKLYDNFSSMLKHSLMIQELISEQTSDQPESEKTSHIQTTSKDV